MSNPPFTVPEATAATDDVLAYAMRMRSHSLALTALLSAYGAIATHYTCCAPAAVVSLRHLADMLEAATAGAAKPGQQLH